MSNQTKYDVVIIGAGIGGLTCGNILAKKGLSVLILEKNPVPGGAATTFFRNSFPIDIAHAVCAFRNGSFMHSVFKFLGIDSQIRLKELDKSFIYLSDTDKKTINCYTDFKKYADHLSSNFPKEEKNINRLFKDMHFLWTNELSVSYYNPSIFQLLKYPLTYPHLFKYRNITFSQFLNKYLRSSVLKEIVSCPWTYLGLNQNSLSALYMIAMISAYHDDKTHFVYGGFGSIAKELANNLCKQGGHIKYNTNITRLLLDKRGCACGAEDNANNSYLGKNIISNIDSKATFLKLCDKNMLPKHFIKKISNLSMSCSIIQVHIVANASDINKEFLTCGTIILPFKIDLEEKIKIILKERSSINNKSALSVSIKLLSDFISTDKQLYVFNVGWLPANYKLWKKLIENHPHEYNNIKQEITDKVIKTIRKVWQIKDIHFYNAITPISVESWLGSSEGAIYDLACTPNQMLLNRLRHITPIRNLYLVGAKSFPGPGISGATLSSISVSDIILKGQLTKGKFVLNS